MKAFAHAAVALAVSSAAPCWADENYPNKPITLVVPWNAGGTTDSDARIWANFAKELLGQPILVVNKPGFSSIIGTTQVANSKPDGYTLLQGSAGSNVIAPLTQKTEYGLDSFEYVARFTAGPSGIVVDADSSWKTLDDLIRDAKAKPDTLTFSSIGVGSWTTLAMTNWEKQAGIKLRHIHYQGGAPAVTALLGKHVDVHFNFPQVFLPHVKAGKLRLLVADEKFAGVNNPTFHELGYKGSYSGWSGIVAPKGTSPAIVRKLGEVTAHLMKDPKFIEAVRKSGATPLFMGPNEFDAFVRHLYTDELGGVIKELGLDKEKGKAS
jgi:tripartite-type tricarboxylate transporter receptor subunit TctC